MSFDDIISNIRERAEILKSQGMNAQRTPEDPEAKVASMQAHGERIPMNKVVQNSPTREQPPLPKRPTCSFCRNQHSSLKCPKFSEMTRDERVNAIKDKYLCFRCLSPDHISKFCPCPKPRCGSCSGPHQTFLHYDEGEYIPAYTSAYAQASSQQRGDDHHHGSNHGNNNNNNNNDNNNNGSIQQPKANQATTTAEATTPPPTTPPTETASRA